SQMVHYVRGRILAKLGRRQEAEKELTKAAQMQSATNERDKEAVSLDRGRVPNPELKKGPQ
ncbi:MAG TPA: hypothetical protein VNB49_14650, partial [Candidatus Dormibacteraeota bacterium]|nr:hypothetical protein [Candidatus Dormibacteraeota bacterium]